MQEIIIKLKRGKTISIMKSIIKDGISVTSFSEKQQARMTYDSMKRANTPCDFKNDCIIQFFVDKTEKDILNMAEEQVIKMAKDTGIEVEITKNEIKQ